MPPRALLLATRLDRTGLGDPDLERDARFAPARAVATPYASHGHPPSLNHFTHTVRE